MALAQIREEDAQGPVAEAYAQLRRALGVPVVNFIWRHLATIDGGLDFALPRVERARNAIDAALARVSREADRLVAENGLDAMAGDELPILPQMRDVIAVYDRGNSWNFLSMAVLAAARGGNDAPTPAGHSGVQHRELPSVQPMPRHETLAPELFATIDRLASAGPAAASGVRPSLWVHLALWPEEFAALAPSCAAILKASAFAQAYADFQGRGPGILGFDAPLPTADAPPGEEPIDRAIRLFRMRIAEMVLVGRVLLHASRARGLSN
jgi:hypothetical protein